MTRFNPPRRQATDALSLACINLADVAIRRTIKYGNITPRRGDVISFPSRRLSRSRCEPSSEIYLLVDILSSVGIEGRKALCRYKHRFGEYVPFELVHNDAGHWSVVIDNVVTSTNSDPQVTVQSLAIHCTRDRIAFDVSINPGRYDAVMERRFTSSKNLTIEQLQRAYRTYLSNAGIHLLYDVPSAKVGPIGSEYEISRVLSALGTKSLEALINTINAETEPGGAHPYRLTINPDAVESDAMREIDNGWTLTAYVTYSNQILDVRYIVVYEERLTATQQVERLDRNLRNCQWLMLEYTKLRDRTAKQLEAKRSHDAR